VRSVEDALGIKIPRQANVIRNLMHATLYAQDHLVHFYHLHALDWVDVVSALNADPVATSQLAQSIRKYLKSFFAWTQLFLSCKRPNPNRASWFSLTTRSFWKESTALLKGS
jgi:Ni,Fe-hydrogenase I large subunit